MGFKYPDMSQTENSNHVSLPKAGEHGSFLGQNFLLVDLRTLLL